MVSPAVYFLMHSPAGYGPPESRRRVCITRGNQFNHVTSGVVLPAPKKREQAIVGWNERPQPRIAVGQTRNRRARQGLSIRGIDPSKLRLPAVALARHALAADQHQPFFVHKMKAKEILRIELPLPLSRRQIDSADASRRAHH